MREQTTTVRINVSTKQELEQQAIIKSYKEGKMIKWTDLLKELLKKAMVAEGISKKKAVNNCGN